MDSTTTDIPIFEDQTDIDEQLKEIAEQYAINQGIGRILVKKYDKVKKKKEQHEKHSQTYTNRKVF